MLSLLFCNTEACLEASEMRPPRTRVTIWGFSFEIVFNQYGGFDAGDPRR